MGDEMSFLPRVGGRRGRFLLRALGIFLTFLGVFALSGVGTRPAALSVALPYFAVGGAILIHWGIQMVMRDVRESRRYLWISFAWACVLFAACLVWTVPHLSEFASYYVSEKGGTTRHNPIYMSFGGSLIGMPICAYASWVTWRGRNDDPRA